MGGGFNLEQGLSYLVICYFYSNIPIALWNQFDGVAFVNTNSDSYYNKFKGFFSTDNTAEYRKMAFLGSIPKWKGFSLVDEEIQPMTATEAIVKLENAMYCLSRVLVEESGNCYRKQPSQFDAQKVRGFKSSSIYMPFINHCKYSSRSRAIS